MHNNPSGPTGKRNKTSLSHLWSPLKFCVFRLSPKRLSGKDFVNILAGTAGGQGGGTHHSTGASGSAGASLENG